MAGGNVGFGLGSLAIVYVVAYLGLERTWIMAGFGLVTVGTILWFALPRAGIGHPHPDLGGRRTVAVAPARRLLVLFIVVVLRARPRVPSSRYSSLLLHARGASLQLGGYAVFAYCLAGAVEDVGRGWPAPGSGGDAGPPPCWPPQPARPALYLYLHHQIGVTTILLLLGGRGPLAGLAINIVMAQQLLPRHASTASGLVMGLAWGVGAFSAKFVGDAADRLAASLGPALGLRPRRRVLPADGGGRLAGRATVRGTAKGRAHIGLASEALVGD